jgi:hypothetical protein
MVGVGSVPRLEQLWGPVAGRPGAQEAGFIT